MHAHASLQTNTRKEQGRACIRKISHWSNVQLLFFHPHIVDASLPRLGFQVEEVRTLMNLTGVGKRGK